MSEFLACPDPEVLAAFIDGRLSDVERRRLVAHLDACADCYEVFAETVRFQGEEEPRGRLLGAGRFGSRRWVWMAAAAAAVLLVLVTVPVLRMSSGRAASEAEALIAAITVADGAELAAALGPPPPAGGLGFAGDRVETASFRAGVALLERAAAAQARDLGAAVREMEVPATEARDPFFVSFGQWAEAGRLAAEVGDGGFFRSPAFIELRERIAGADLPADVAEVVAEIQATTLEDDAEPLNAEDLAALKRLFEELIAKY